MFLKTGWVFSHNLAHKCCKAAGIHSKAEKVVITAGEESILFPNQVKGHWNATAPLQLVVSDMTTLKVGTTYWEWTILLDTFNNEILAHSVTSQRGSNKPYYHCLEQLKNMMDKREEQTSQVVLHTDQGAVYSSRAFCQAHHNYNILRSMSRGGTPTDNPIIEALNGWIKEELYLDFDLAHTLDVPALLDAYVLFFNNHRPAAALGYRSVQFKTETGLLINILFTVYFLLTSAPGDRSSFFLANSLLLEQHVFHGDEREVLHFQRVGLALIKHRGFIDPYGKPASVL